MSLRLALGTVQLGLEYGVANENGRPSDATARAVLDTAWSMGIRNFDTASAYGIAESILGRWHPSDSHNIVSKFAGTIEGVVSKELEAGLRGSLERLGRKQIYGYLLHDANRAGDTQWLSALAGLKTLGLVEKVGISIYNPEQAMLAASSPFVDIIQIPYSMMDQRLDECGFFDLAKGKGKEIWARSAFVQGLLFMDEAKVPDHLQGILPFRRTALQIGKRYGFGMQDVAILFSLGNQAIDQVLIGVDTVDQLQEYVGVESKLKAYAECRSELVDALRGKVDPYFVSPHQWVKK